MSINEKREYCLNCKNRPCKNKGCPLENDIPCFIHEYSDEIAFDILAKTTVLPAVCGRICPHSRLCQKYCVRGIMGESVHIGEIEAYLGDKLINSNYKYKKKKKIVSIKVLQ